MIQTVAPALLFLFVSGASMQVAAQDSAEDVADRIAKCSDIMESQARLDCFDSISNGTRPTQSADPKAASTDTPASEPISKPAAAAAGAATSTNPAPDTGSTAQVTEASGESTPAAAVVGGAQNSSPEIGEEYVKDHSEERMEPSKYTEVMIVRIDRDPYDRVVLELDNGQVWRQSEASKHINAPKEMPALGTVRRGFLGSYTILIDETEQRVGIKRLQ